MRKETNSITHLVKIVAKEVFDENKKDLVNQITNEVLNVQENKYEALKEIANTYLSNMASSLVKAGEPWCADENALLEQEYRTAIAQIAKNHSRSIGAIKAQLARIL